MKKGIRKIEQKSNSCVDVEYSRPASQTRVSPWWKVSCHPEQGPLELLLTSHYMTPSPAHHLQREEKKRRKNIFLTDNLSTWKYHSVKSYIRLIFTTPTEHQLLLQRPGDIKHPERHTHTIKKQKNVNEHSLAGYPRTMDVIRVFGRSLYKPLKQIWTPPRLWYNNIFFSEDISHI